MSTTIATIERITSVEPHPNADRLDVVKVLGFQVVTGKGNCKPGDDVFYFPPDLLLPAEHADALGVTNYLKHATFPGETEKRPCRVGAARLRGVPSYGFVAPVDVSPVPMESYEVGQDVTEWFGAEKYVPPVRVGCGEAERDFGTFHQYTSIENIQRYPDLIPEGTDVIITEKIHGTNSRMGLCRDNSGEHIFMAGSHKVRRKAGEGLYWAFFTDEIRAMLSMISDANEGADVILFGEIFGPGVQDMHYAQTEKVFRAFDISVDGKYLDYEKFLDYCHAWNIETVPEIYIGPFSHAVCESYTYGDTTFGVTSGFKGREGIVIKPVIEQVDRAGRRMIAKSVSADYLSRKGAEDNE